MTARELVEKIQWLIDNKEISEDADVLVGCYHQISEEVTKCDSQGNIHISGGPVG